MASKPLTDQMIKTSSGKYDVENVFTLAVTDSEITNLDDVRHCVHLLDLDLHNNKIRDILPLSHCVDLERINISSNLIYRLDPLALLTSLAYLHAQDNRIATLDQLTCLKPLTKLKALYLQNIDGSRSNPVCQCNGYQEYILSICPSLDILDGRRLRLEHDFYKLTTTVSVESPRLQIRPTIKPTLITANTAPIPVDTSYIDSICQELQDELKHCKTLIAEVDTFLKLRDCKGSLSTNKTSTAR